MPVQPPVSRSLSSAADGGSLRRLHELSFRKMSFLAYVRNITKEHQPSGWGLRRRVGRLLTPPPRRGWLLWPLTGGGGGIKMVML
uniref:Uncharacterized protein n=1 Tax=Oryza meridionalis TaxID=40149 RepID=A0A0E0CDN5_9ORYZ